MAKKKITTKKVAKKTAKKKTTKKMTKKKATKKAVVTSKKTGPMKNVTMLNVDSGVTQKIGYDGIRNELFVIFKDGTTYKYSGVPDSIYKGLLQAEIFDFYFDNKIMGVYTFEKIED